jgi:hypothetical protein
MTPIFISIAAMITMVALAVIVLFMVDRFRYRAPTPEQRAERDRQYREALLNPQWEIVASRFGGTVPAPLRRLYSDTELIVRTELRIGDADIARFVPADADALDHEGWFHLPDDALVLAVSPFGDPFYVRAHHASEGLPVFVLYHDGDDRERVADTLDAFIDSLRASP